MLNYFYVKSSVILIYSTRSLEELCEFSIRALSEGLGDLMTTCVPVKIVH